MNVPREWSGWLAAQRLDTIHLPECQQILSSLALKQNVLIQIEIKIIDSSLVQGSGFEVQGVGFMVQGSRFRIQGSGFKVQGSGCRVQGSGFRVQGSGFRV